jgi:hypothetical protein
MLPPPPPLLLLLRLPQQPLLAAYCEMSNCLALAGSSPTRKKHFAAS